MIENEIEKREKEKKVKETGWRTKVRVFILNKPSGYLPLGFNSVLETKIIASKSILIMLQILSWILYLAIKGYTLRIYSWILNGSHFFNDTFNSGILLRQMPNSLYMTHNQYRAIIGYRKASLFSVNDTTNHKLTQYFLM